MMNTSSHPLNLEGCLGKAHLKKTSYRASGEVDFSDDAFRETSTVKNTLPTACQSPPRPPSRRLPLVTSGWNYYYDDNYDIVFSNRAGSILAKPLFGPKDGVHLKVRRFLM